MVSEQSHERPRSSYKEGKVRDARIEAMREKGFSRGDFQQILHKAAKPADVTIHVAGSSYSRPSAKRATGEESDRD